jgi:hypothetical protein
METKKSNKSNKPGEMPNHRESADTFGIESRVID